MHLAHREKRLYMMCTSSLGGGLPSSLVFKISLRICNQVAVGLGNMDEKSNILMKQQQNNGS